MGNFDLQRNGGQKTRTAASEHQHFLNCRISPPRILNRFHFHDDLQNSCVTSCAQATISNTRRSASGRTWGALPEKKSLSSLTVKALAALRRQVSCTAAHFASSSADGRHGLVHGTFCPTSTLK